MPWLRFPGYTFVVWSILFFFEYLSAKKRETVGLNERMRVTKKLLFAVCFHYCCYYSLVCTALLLSYNPLIFSLPFLLWWWQKAKDQRTPVAKYSPRKNESTANPTPQNHSRWAGWHWKGKGADLSPDTSFSFFRGVWFMGDAILCLFFGAAAVESVKYNILLRFHCFFKPILGFFLQKKLFKR